MSIRRWQPRKTSTPITKPSHRRSRLGLAVLGACILLAGLFGLRAYNAPKPTLRAAPTAPVSHGGPWTKRIDEVGVCERVTGLNPELSDAERNWVEPDPATWRKLELRAPKTDGSTADVTLVRPPAWLEEQGAAVGGTVFVSVPECSIEGHAEVLSIGPCPPVQPGEGPVVTGIFRHHSAAVVDLHVEGLSEPIGTTANHLFWSEDRQQFIRADELREGEHLRTLAGTSRVVKITPRSTPEPVYNLEVQGEHVYQVTTSGVLVHNGSPENCRRIVGSSSQILSRTGRQLQRKFKHASDFGVAGNYSKLNAAKFSAAINKHINSPVVKTIKGTYRGNPVIHYLDPQTGLNVIADRAGNFISGWKLSPKQLQHVLNFGKL